MCRVEVNNIPKDAEKFVIARLVDAELWYWGSWSDEEDAKKKVKEIENGLVLEN